MSHSTKEGKRQRLPQIGKGDPAVDAVKKRHLFGSTEKILRRNRGVWVRLGNKRRRQADKATVEDALE